MVAKISSALTVVGDLNANNFSGDSSGTNTGDPIRGVATLSGGSITVSNASITATSRIFLTSQSPGGVTGSLSVNSRVNGVSFTIRSSSILDTSVVGYLIY